MAETYSYLGPAGTFTWVALGQVEAAQGAEWRPVSNVGEALHDVTSGRSAAAMIAIENSVEGGVSATQDALANIPGLRIVGEYVVPVNFDLVALSGTSIAEVSVVTAHPVAYGQSHQNLERLLAGHEHLPAASNIAAPESLLSGMSVAQAALAPAGYAAGVEGLVVLAEKLADNPNAATRFVLVTAGREVPERTGSDKTSVIVELPTDAPGALVEMLEQFATRGVNLILLESRPIGDALGRYRFVIDFDGHILDERVADALLGLKRFSPNVVFLGSYPRADGQPVEAPARYADEVFIEARDWLRGIVSGEPE